MSAVAGLLVAAVSVPVTGLVGVVTRDAANTFNDLKVPQLGQVPQRSELLNTDGQVIAYYYPDGIYRIPVKYSQISPDMRNAIVAIEDDRFYQHGAIDPRGTFRAFINDVNNESVQGGSTLAQQYVKNALILTSQSTTAQEDATEDTAERKIRELRIAANVVHELSPHQLLAAYLNVAFFDNNAYGIQVAASRYFGPQTDAADLNLAQSALLAGMVENPSQDNPLGDPAQQANALNRRNTVLARMASLGYISQATANQTMKEGLGLHPSTATLATGCSSPSAVGAAYFCDYVLAVLARDPFYKKVYQALNTTGGLKIYTTMDPQDQAAAQTAVDWVAPPNDPNFNPEHIADTEVLIKPGTGQVKAIAVDRVYGTAAGQTNIDYGVNGPFDGGVGVQTGSSSKLFTLVTALEQGIPFGFSQTVTSPASIGGYTNCKGQSDSLFNVSNAEGATTKPEVFTLYNGTTQSINVFFAMLEQKVGLCNVVKTAVNMGVTRADGASLLAPSAGQLPADDIPSFTLGAVNVSPMSMAGAYATVAANGVYCKPIAIQSIVSGHRQLPVEAPGCHQAIPAPVADAANYILQGVLTSGTAAGRGIGRPAAGKTGTANGGFYAAFGGYTPSLAGYVSVFNPTNPTTTGAMIGDPGSCYRENPQTGGGEECPGQMFGDNAPAATWQMTFTHANLGPPVGFTPVPGDTPFFSEGTGVNSPAPPKKGKGKGNGPGGGNGGPGGGGPGGGGGGNPPPPLLSPGAVNGPADIVAGVR
jgi:membrane peptidoglycan carboxypeptidase